MKRLVALALAALVAVMLVRAFLPPPPRPTPLAEKPRRAFEADALARTLGAAIACATVNPEREGPVDPAALECLHALLARDFPRLHAGAPVALARVAGQSLLYEWRGSDPSLAPILLMAHQDVVPAGGDDDGVRWTHPPFAGAVDAGRVWGRGALDDKGSLVTLLAAAERLCEEGFAPKRTIYLASGHDEERGGTGAAAIVAELRARRVRLDFVLDEGLAIPVGVVPGVERPVALIGVAEKGYETIDLRAVRPPGHSSTPGPDTAIAALARALAALEDRQAPARIDGIARGQYEALAPEFPFAQRVMLANLWIAEPVVRGILLETPVLAAQLRTTQAITIVAGGVKDNVLPAEAHATVNLRLHPRESAAAALARVRAVVAPFGVEALPRAAQSSDPSPVSSADTRGFRAIASAIAAIEPDAAVVPGLVMGATDGRHFAPIADGVYRFLPIRMRSEDIATVHGVDERIDVAELPRMAAFYYALMRHAASD